jgi:DNA-binding response OmpR family regulator
VRILLVEDESKIARALETAFEREHFETVWARTGDEASRRASSEKFDVIVLDLGLPGQDGIEVLSALRKRGDPTPVLILTARDTVEDRILGLDSGADDYLVKPFAIGEVLARIRALLRRGRPDQALKIKAADLEIDILKRDVTRGGRTLALTPREYDLLEYLLRHKDQLVSREMLARDVWKEVARVTPLDNVIDVHIARLRKKVDEGCDVKLIQTVRGVGFSVREGGAP